MAEVSILKTGYTALSYPKTLIIQPRLPHFQIRVCKLSSFRGLNSINQIESKKFQLCTRKNSPLLVGRNPNYPIVDDDDFAPEPFWSNLMKQAYWAVKSLLEFLVEQPSQLKYIEWPSLQSTLKTATLTLLLVGLLIIALSSVDAALYYVYAVLTRRRA